MHIAKIPEIQALVQPRERIRIPLEIDVPVTRRVRQLIDSRQFQHLTQISQLGLVKFVYPGATHNRMEHSLGVYRNALLVIHQLSLQPDFEKLVDAKQAEKLIVAALLHDIGHWPFCHPIEDIKLASLPAHENRCRQLISQGEIAEKLERDWGLEPDSVADLVSGKPDNECDQLLASILSGPIDIDKLDYLYRDSLHAGVPYGLNFDRQRLFSSLCLNGSMNGLALTEKGKTAAEMLIFSRYVMFSEVYWHHAVRSATAMLQRAVWELSQFEAPDAYCDLSESDWIREVGGALSGKPGQMLMEGLFSGRRKLFKRLIQISALDAPELYHQIARRPYPWLVQFGQAITEEISRREAIPIRPDQLLVDAPPVKLEVQFQVDILTESSDFRPLGELSPMTRTLAQQQFDDLVKRVRIFADPELKLQERQLNLPELLECVLSRMDSPETTGL